MTSLPDNAVVVPGTLREAAEDAFASASSEAELLSTLSVLGPLVEASSSMGGLVPIARALRDRLGLLTWTSSVALAFGNVMRRAHARRQVGVLHTDIMEGLSFAALELLLRNGADPNAPAPAGLPACEELDGVVGTPPFSPLHLAAYRGDAAVVELLLDYGADVGAVDGEGDPPVHWAAAFGKLQVLTVFRDCGVSMTTAHALVRQFGDQIQGLASKTSVQAAEAVCTTPPDGSRLFRLAARGRCRALAVMLANSERAFPPKQEGGVRGGVSAQTDENCCLEGVGLPSTACPPFTALHFAATQHAEACRLLLAAGAEFLPDGSGDTPVDWAVQCGSSDCVEVLLEAGARPTSASEAAMEVLRAHTDQIHGAESKP